MFSQAIDKLADWKKQRKTRILKKTATFFDPPRSRCWGKLHGLLDDTLLKSRLSNKGSRQGQTTNALGLSSGRNTQWSVGFWSARSHWCSVWHLWMTLLISWDLGRFEKFSKSAAYMWSFMHDHFFCCSRPLCIPDPSLQALKKDWHVFLSYPFKNCQNNPTSSAQWSTWHDLLLVWKSERTVPICHQHVLRNNLELNFPSFSGAHLGTTDDAFSLFSLGLLAQEPALASTRPQWGLWPSHVTPATSQSKPRDPHRLLGTKEKNAQVLGRFKT